MLNIYTGRENIDKEKAMFGKINPSFRTCLIVPDQYTLQMERNAIDYYETEGLMNLEVLSFSRLTARVLAETGGSPQKVIDKNGRHMLLSKILLSEKKNLKAFGGMVKSHSFIDLMNNLISEVKQHNGTPDDVAQALSLTESSVILNRKLSDLYLIFTKYEEALKDKFIDTEAYLDFFITKIGKSKLVKESEFWISGFDSLTPKAVEIIKELSSHSRGVNMMLTYEKGSKIFSLTETTLANLKRALGLMQIRVKELEGPEVSRPEAVSHLERYLFEPAVVPLNERREELTFLNAANFYNEAESAAAFILELVRDKGLRFKDIAVICNDMEERGTIIQRVFDEYEISFFLDKKRPVHYNPAVVFVISLLEAASSDWAYEDIFSLVKTGLTPLSVEDSELLENYCIKYKIRGSSWKKDFKYGLEEYGEEDMRLLNGLRGELLGFLGDYFESSKKAETISEKILVLTEFLREKLHMEDILEQICLNLEAEGQFVPAMEISQIWDEILDLLEQLNELLGDETINNEDFAKIIRSGFDSMELGLIPTTMDQVVIGTMERTRTGNVKALLVLGANDGVLPRNRGEEDLLSRDEKKQLIDKGILICRDEDHKLMEENLAIYKQLSGAGQHLWLSFSTANLDGQETRPSMIFNKTRKMFPANPVEKDIANREDPSTLLIRPAGSFKYFAEALQMHYREGHRLDPVWQSAANWYRENHKEKINLIEKGLNFDNRVEKLSRTGLSNLFGLKPGERLRLSPTRLETYSRCPFAHMIRYGLRPDENRVFHVSGREVGDIYHLCLKLFAQDLTVEGLPLQDAESPWMQITETEVEERITDFMAKLAPEYKEGLFESDKEANYRLARMTGVCQRAAKALVDHIRRGAIEKIFFEERFSSAEGSLLPPISVSTENGDFSIEGIIDRIDILPYNYAKIIDYKSGRESFNPGEATGGWRLQLMLYLKAVREGMEYVKSAGVFYFEIADLMVEGDGQSREEILAAVEKEIRKSFRLDGTVLNESKVIESIAGDFESYSHILPIKKDKDGLYSGNTEGRMLSKEEFEKLEKTMDQVISQLCSSLAAGNIDIRPKKLDDISACTYCTYKSICGFDLSFDGCSYDVVKS